MARYRSWHCFQASIKVVTCSRISYIAFELTLEEGDWFKILSPADAFEIKESQRSNSDMDESIYSQPKCKQTGHSVMALQTHCTDWAVSWKQICPRRLLPKTRRRMEYLHTITSLRANGAAAPLSRGCDVEYFLFSVQNCYILEC